MTTHRKSGFSLLELAIVMFVVGLLAGGVLMGQNLIRQSEIAAASARIQEVRNAFVQFTERYGCLPGDCKNATDFFPEGQQLSSGELVGNGDGNGQIVCVTPWCSAPINEHEAAIGEMALAGFLKGEYDEDAGIGECHMTIFWEDVTLYDSPPANYLRLEHNLEADPWHQDCLTPEDAQAIDAKIDDGKPATGSTVGRTNISSPQAYTKCTDSPYGSAAQPNAVYSITSSDIGCSLYNRLQ